MSQPPGDPDLAPLSTLDDPVRHRLYEIVTRHAGPVGRDEAASASRTATATASSGCGTARSTSWRSGIANWSAA